MKLLPAPNARTDVANCDLEEPDRIDQPRAAPDLRRESLDERQVVEVELVVQVERVE
jgi:hypothetical protein